MPENRHPAFTGFRPLANPQGRPDQSGGGTEKRIVTCRCSAGNQSWAWAHFSSLQDGRKAPLWPGTGCRSLAACLLKGR